MYSDGGGSGIVGGDGVLANTGMYLVTDSRIDFRVNGAERLRINSAGLVLIGTTADVAGGATSSKLQIRSTSYDASLAIVANRTNSGGGNLSKKI